MSIKKEFKELMLCALHQGFFDNAIKLSVTMTKEFVRNMNEQKCNCGCHEEMIETCDLCSCKEGTLK